MKPRSRNLLFKLKNLPSRLPKRLMSLSKKLLKLKLLKLSLTKLLKNSKDCIQSVISSISNGKTLWRTVEEEMSLSMKLQFNLEIEKLSLREKRKILNNISKDLAERRRPINPQKVKSKTKKETWLSRDTNYRQQMRKPRHQKVKLLS